MYTIGQTIVHPLHGAGIIKRIIEKNEGGAKKVYYELSFGGGDMSVTLPEDKCGEVGLRPIICRKEAERIFKAISELEVPAGDGNWNRRYRENMLKIKSGDPLMVGGVIKSLMRRDCARGLSTGERRMLHYAKDILISEMTVSMELPSDDIENKLTLAVG